MRALVLGDEGLRLDPCHPDPKPRRNEAIVRVLLAGICGTDLEMLHGYKGFRGVPGHEFVGVVERADRMPQRVGSRVVGEINVGCGRCARCRQEAQQHCGKRTVLGISGRDGAFAERLVLPLRHLVVLPRGATIEAAVFAEPLAAARRVLDQVGVDSKTRVVVLGPGRLGSLVAAVLGRRTRRVELVGREDSARPDADVVVDCTGSPDGFARAVAIVRPRGTIVLKSTTAADASVPASLLTAVVVNEITVVGSRCGSSVAFRQALIALATGEIDPTPLVEETYPLAEFERAFEHAARPGALKVLLDLA